MTGAIKELEARFWKIDGIINEIEGEIQWARHLGCADLLDDGVQADRDAMYAELWRIERILEEAWKNDHTAVSPELAAWMDEQEKLYDEMARMAEEDQMFAAWLKEQEAFCESVA